MSTPATITFSDENEKVSVHSQGYGYPSGILEALNKALMLAWELPRFEACEFAASFIAMNKVRQGGFRVIQKPSKYGVAYHYDVTCKAGRLHIICKKADHNDKLTKHASGSLSDMSSWQD